MSLEQARQYLARVLPWPQPGDPQAWIDVIWSFKPKDGRPGKYWGGRAVQSVDEAANAIAWVQTLPDTLDIYACQSSQRTAQAIATKTGKVYYKPVRLQENAVALKALFLDIDGDKQPDPDPTKVVKGYPTMREALTALKAFIAAVGLPKPSIMVTSGGGLHVYWVFNRALTPEEWYPLACALIEATKRHGLRLDEAVTTDAARILRVPDTFNRKKDRPRQVKIAGTPTDFDYAVEFIAKLLEPYKVDAVFQGSANMLKFEVAGVPQRPPLKEESDLAGGVVFTMPQQEVRACLDEIPNNRIDWNFWNTIGMRVFAATDGAQYGLDEWQRWSDTNPVSGSGESCEARWGVLLQSPPTRTGAGALVNEVRNLTGNPQWQARAIAVESATLGVSQLQVAVTPQVTTGAVAVASPLIDVVPDGFIRNPQGLVFKVSVDENGNPLQIPVSNYPITNGVLQKDPWALFFDTTTERGRATRVALQAEFVGTNEMRKILQLQGLMVDPKPALITEFFLGWIKKLQETRDAVATAPFGWSPRGRLAEGFVYGGKMFTPEGVVAANTSDPVLAKQYSPVGELDPWLRCADLITLQERPDLNAILASAFAAPLVNFSNQRGLLMSVYSSESGYGKTTALTVAQTVWGKPNRTQGSGDTLNSVFGKMGQLRSLPLYWDEIKTEEDTQAFVKLAFQLTKGSEKSRMRANTTIHDSGEWKTLLVSATNTNLAEYIIARTSTTTAGIMRLFEFEVTPGSKHQLSRTEADEIMAGVDHNYGAAGLIYAQFLGENSARVREEFHALDAQIGLELKETKDERFWTVMVTSICLGARYANELGLTDIDEAALKTFMFEKFMEQRVARANTTVDMKKAINVSNLLAQFLNAMKQRHTMVTNRIHIRAGKPPKGSITVMCDTSKLDGIYVHVGVDDKLLRISSTFFSEWLADKNYSRQIFMKALEKEFGCKLVHGRIASGVSSHVGATEYLLEISLAGSPLADFIDEA